MGDNCEPKTYYKSLGDLHKLAHKYNYYHTCKHFQQLELELDFYYYAQLQLLLHLEINLFR